MNAAVRNCSLLFQKYVMSVLTKAACLGTGEDCSRSISGACFCSDLHKWWQVYLEMPCKSESHYRETTEGWSYIISLSS